MITRLLILNTLASHLIGYLGEVSKQKVKENKYYNNGDLFGVKGIEGQIQSKGHIRF